MQFKKKKKRQKSSGVDENLLREQERLFDEAKKFSQMLEGQEPPALAATGSSLGVHSESPAVLPGPLPRELSTMSEPAREPRFGERLEPPPNLVLARATTDSAGLIQELDKKLIKPSSAIDATDFDAPDIKPS